MEESLAERKCRWQAPAPQEPHHNPSSGQSHRVHARAWPICTSFKNGSANKCSKRSSDLSIDSIFGLSCDFYIYFRHYRIWPIRKRVQSICINIKFVSIYLITLWQNYWNFEHLNGVQCFTTFTKRRILHDCFFKLVLKNVSFNFITMLKHKIV